MLLLGASGANVSWQGINPPGAGGYPLAVPDTTLAGRLAPDSGRSLPGPVSPLAVGSPGSSQTSLNLERLSLF